MLYHIVKPIIRIALFFFCRKIYFNNKKYFSQEGPLLLAVNHPNSFLDAIIIGVFFKQPVYFLARGDAFKNKWALKILTSLKCKPVYRLREGKEYLHLNDSTFEACKEVFQKNGIVLIFSEGLCENEWEIRPLKKGTARLTFSYWKQFSHINNLKVLPVGINYNSFRKLPKKVWVNFGEYIQMSDFNVEDTEGNLYTNFNNTINNQWKDLCFHSNWSNDKQVKSNIENILTFTRSDFETFSKEISQVSNQTPQLYKKLSFRFINFFQVLVSLPALIFLYPFYFLIRKIVYSIAGKSVHYDSILFGAGTLFFLFYFPVLMLILALLITSFHISLLIIALLIISLTFLTKFELNCYSLIRQ